ncbi:MAG: hypothetical protein JWN41_1810 [Thermoleophilia bacterium]|nr:hypothetical protein [Thermoleophilia bacterium]
MGDQIDPLFALIVAAVLIAICVKRALKGEL